MIVGRILKHRPVAIIHKTLGRGPIGPNHIMAFQLDMVIGHAWHMPHPPDRSPIHQRPGGDQQPIDPKRMTRRNIKIPLRHPIAQRPRAEPHRLNLRIARNKQPIISPRPDPNDRPRNTLAVDHPIPDRQRLNGHLASFGQDLRASAKTRVGIDADQRPTLRILAQMRIKPGDLGGNHNLAVAPAAAHRDAAAPFRQ